MTHTLLIAAGLAFSSVSYILLKAPFACIFISWFFILFFCSIFSKKTTNKLAFLYLSLIPIALGIFEIYLQTQEHNKVRQKNTRGVVNKKHEILGYAPKPNTKAFNTKTINGKVVYDVEYNIDGNGLRISPPHHPNEMVGSILFFGGSFTFGTGLNDTETMPYQVGIKNDGRYHIYNFGYRGYGPHQMLSAIDNGLVKKIVKHNPKYAIYQALIGHIGRAGGLAFWDTHGPKYTLDKDGKVIWKGHYNKWLTPGLRKSLIYRRIISKKISKKYFDHTQVRLFIEIIHHSKKELETQFPGCEFHVLLWGSKYHENFLEILEILKQKEINVHLVKDIFKNTKIPHPPSGLKINKYDPHPTNLANEIIADYVTRNIIGNQRETDDKI